MKNLIKQEKFIEKQPIPVTFEDTELILLQMGNCICKIFSPNNIKGTGFFCKIPYNMKHKTLSNFNFSGTKNCQAASLKKF